MAIVNLEFPVWVQNKKSGYSLRPLFIKDPCCENRRFQKALHQMQREVQKEFRGFKVDRENVDKLLWYMFHPELKFEKMELTFKSGARTVSGIFTVVWFELANERIVCLPAFDGFVGMWQSRLEAILDYLTGRLKRYSNHADSLYVDNMVALLHVGKSAQNDMTLSDVFKPYLAKRKRVSLRNNLPAGWV